VPVVYRRSHDPLVEVHLVEDGGARLGDRFGLSTMPKMIKSAAELTELIMAELHKHSQCKDVLRIRITRPVTKNWDVTIMRSPGRVCPPVCRNILEATVQRLRALYDLSGKK
jgi:hypothetical protein